MVVQMLYDTVVLSKVVTPTCVDVILSVLLKMLPLHAPEKLLVIRKQLLTFR